MTLALASPTLQLSQEKSRFLISISTLTASTCISRLNRHRPQFYSVPLL